MLRATQAGTPQPPVRRTFRAFDNPCFRFLWPSNFLVYLSRWMQMTLLAWFVLELTGSPWFVALTGFFAFAPMLAIGLLGGLLADSVNRRRLLVTTQTTSLLSTVALTALLHTGIVEFWYAYVALAVLGTAWALEMPSTRSVIHDLVGSEGVTNALALDSLAMNGSRMAGPALAGLLIALTEVNGGYTAVGSFQAIALGLLLMARVPSESRGELRPRQMVQRLREGIAYVRGSRIILAAVTVTFLANLFLFPFIQLVPVVARDVLGVGPALMGLLQSADGLGAVFGSVLIASASGLRCHGGIYLAGTGLAMLALLLFSFSRWYGVSVLMLMILGLGTAAFGTMQAAIVMLAAREEMRGRALGVISLAIGAIPLGSLMIGAIADALGPAMAIRILAGAGLVSMVLVALVMNELWHRPTSELVDRDARPAP